MSARSQTKIFGVRVNADPKIIVGVLMALAVALFFYNRSADDSEAGTQVARHEAASAPGSIPSAPLPLNAARRSRQTLNDRGTLRLRPIDPTKGDVDPTLRLDLLSRLQSVQADPTGRSLFELGPAPLTPAENALLKHPPAVSPKPVPAQPPATSTTALEEAANIPLKYYGFVKSGEKNQGNEGLFLDGDNVLVGSEGEVVMKKYLVVALTPNSARLEDTQLKKGQTLNVVPAATP